MKEIKHKIVVSEPWDYEGRDKTNVIIGAIVDSLSLSCLIFKSDELLTFGDVSGQLLLLKPRYEGQSLKDLRGSVGGALLMLDEYEKYDENDLEKNSKYVLIGFLDVLDCNDSLRIKPVPKH